jgi:hypothetical protein
LKTKIKVEANVVLVQAIGGKAANALFALAAFTKLPKNLTFVYCIFIIRAWNESKEYFGAML